MKNLFTLITALLTVMNIVAQDIIVTTNAQRIDAKILEVSKTEIRYKEADNLDGPTFVIETKEISSIIYANGKVTLYNNTTSVENNAENISTSEEKPVISKQVDGNATILLLTGETIDAQIKDMNSSSVTYIKDNISFTIPASQISTITFANGQIKTYSSQNINIHATTPTPKADNKTIHNSSSSGRIYRDNKEYMYNNTYISSKEVARILKRENAAAYSQWKKGDGMLIGGAVCVGIGGGLAIGGLITLVTGDYIPCLAMDCAALVPLGVGLGLTLGANSRYNKAIDIYNSKHDQTAMQFNLFASPTEVGIALKF